MRPERLDIGKVLDFVRDRGFFGGFERLRVDYDLDHAMEVVEAIGKMRSPHFVIDSENRFAYENLIKWCHGDPTMLALDPLTGQVVPGDLSRGIYIAGNTGSGKSWCLEIMLAYAQAWGLEIRFPGDKGSRPLFWSLNRADDICHEYMTTGEIQKYRKTRILGIQDLGQEQRESLYMGNRICVLGQLLEYRGDQDDQITLITSNFRISSDSMKQNYGDRVQSRLVEMCNYLEIKGKDRRKSRIMQ